MILQICGNIIDTKYIYNVRNVNHICESQHFIDAVREIEHFEFTVDFINQKSITISHSRDLSRFVGSDLYLKNLTKFRGEMCDIRDQLICKWKANQLVIPKIEFDEDNSIT